LEDGRKDLESLLRARYVLAISVPRGPLITSKKQALELLCAMPGVEQRSRELEANRQLPSLTRPSVTIATALSALGQRFGPRAPPEDRQTQQRYPFCYKEELAVLSTADPLAPPSVRRVTKRDGKGVCSLFGVLGGSSGNTEGFCLCTAA